MAIRTARGDPAVGEALAQIRAYALALTSRSEFLDLLIEHTLEAAIELEAKETPSNDRALALLGGVVHKLGCARALERRADRYACHTLVAFAHEQLAGLAGGRLVECDSSRPPA